MDYGLEFELKSSLLKKFIKSKGSWIFFLNMKHINYIKYKNRLLV